MVKFGGKIGTLYQMLKNAFKKHPLQNRTNVQIKGGGGQRPFEQCSKKHHFSPAMASLIQGKKRRSIEVTVGCEEEATSSEGTDENLEVRDGEELESESESDFFFTLTFMLLGHLYVLYHPS